MEVGAVVEEFWTATWISKSLFVPLMMRLLSVPLVAPLAKVEAEVISEM